MPASMHDCLPERTPEEKSSQYQIRNPNRADFGAIILHTSRQLSSIKLPKLNPDGTQHIG
jgi:hypothetical protein